MMDGLAPVAVFAYNRPSHLRRTLESLAACPEAARTRLLVHCDGPRREIDAPRVRACVDVVRERDWCGATELLQQPDNLGLAASITQGVTAACARWERVIVLEDDVQVCRHFLTYMNEALARYRHDARVYQVSGHSFPAPAYVTSRGSSFLPFPTTWGWATWRRAWNRYDADMKGCEVLGSDAAMRLRFDLNGSYGYYRMLRRLRGADRMADSWGIRWYWSMFRNEGLVLYPHRTLTRHFGDDGSGTNGTAPPRVPDAFDPSNDVVTMPDRIETNLSYFAAVKRHLAQENTLLRRGERLVHRVLRQSVLRTSHAAS